jgi:uncharacterized membrane protein YozB (DUF420 family)
MEGFLGTRASFMLDFVALAMVALVPVLGASVYLVKYRRQYALHKKLQLLLAATLLVAVALFEAEMRISGWRQRAEPSPYMGHGGATNWVLVSLYIHLFFAVSSAVLWVVVLARALRNFPNPPHPSAHSAFHRRFGILAAIDMTCTAVTGWVFYWLAFVA